MGVQTFPVCLDVVPFKVLAVSDKAWCEGVWAKGYAMQNFVSLISKVWIEVEFLEGHKENDKQKMINVQQ